MPAVLPLFNKAVQAADLHFPVSAGSVGSGPRSDFIYQNLALGFDGLGLLFDRLKPSFNDLVGLVAGIVKALPQCVVGCAALV